MSRPSHLSLSLYHFHGSIIDNVLESRKPKFTERHLHVKRERQFQSPSLILTRAAAADALNVKNNIECFHDWSAKKINYSKIGLFFSKKDKRISEKKN